MIARKGARLRNSCCNFVLHALGRNLVICWPNSTQWIPQCSSSSSFDRRAAPRDTMRCQPQSSPASRVCQQQCVMLRPLEDHLRILCYSSCRSIHIAVPIQQQNVEARTHPTCLSRPQRKQDVLAPAGGALQDHCIPLAPQNSAMPTVFSLSSTLTA